MRRFRISLGGFHEIECLVNESRVLLFAKLRKLLLDLFLERFHCGLPFLPLGKHGQRRTGSADRKKRGDHPDEFQGHPFELDDAFTVVFPFASPLTVARVSASVSKVWTWETGANGCTPPPPTLYSCGMFRDTLPGA